jgi:1-acyl-sn-glycerol-3-phosphate acyltransferase
MIYWISYYIFKFIMKVFFRGEVYGRENFPKGQPFIGVMNHNSLLDMVAMALVINFRATSLVKEELFRVPLLSWWLRKIGMVPIVRGASDREAFSRALAALERGEILFIAPEGTRKWKGGERPRPHTGFVRLAQLSGVPVVPCALHGTRQALPPGAWFPRLVKVRAMVGKPIRLEKVEVTRENYDRLLEQAHKVMQEIYRMEDELAAMDYSSRSQEREVAHAHQTAKV